MNLKALLTTRLQAAVNSATEQRFYQNVHAYIDTIMKDDRGRQIMEDAERAYMQGHYELWGVRTEDEEVVDERARQTYKLERFNLYADKFVGMYVRIYLPIEDFKNSHAPLHTQDPVALVALYGHKSKLLDEWAHGGQRSMPPKESRRKLKVYYKWFVGKRDKYTEDLKQFHADFLTAYAYYESDLDVAVPQSLKPPIVINQRTGDFTFYNISDTFNPRTKEYKVLISLLNSKDYFLEYPELISSYRHYKQEQAKATLKPELTQVIKNIKIKLGILQSDNPSPDIIENVKNLGYRLITRDSIETPE